MGAAVDDIHHGHGQNFGVDPAEVLVQGQAEELSRRAGNGHGRAEHGVGPQAGFVVGVVKVKKGVVHMHLAQGIKAEQSVGDFSSHVFHSFFHTLAVVAFFVAVAQLKGFAAAGGGA